MLNEDTCGCDHEAIEHTELDGCSVETWDEEEQTTLICPCLAYMPDWAGIER